MKSSLDASHDVAAPHKLILTLALRTGALQAESVNDMITKMLNRKDRGVQWAHPEWLLIPTGV